MCAIWIPETVFQVHEGHEMINMDSVDKRRRHLKCSVCDQRDTGVSIQCHWIRCAVAYHPLCALTGGLFMKYVESKTNKNSFRTKVCTWCWMLCVCVCVCVCERESAC